MAPQEPEAVVSEELIRQVERRTAAIGDDVAKLRLVRNSVARHEAAARRRERFLRRSVETRQQRMRLAIFIPLTALLLSFSLTPTGSHSPIRRPVPVRIRSVADHPAPKVWLVEREASLEIYSNGLRV